MTPMWGTFKKPILDCVVNIDNAVSTRFPRTRERLVSAASADGLQKASSSPRMMAALPLELGKVLGIGLLEGTEAVLDCLLPHMEPLPESIAKASSSGCSPSKAYADEDDEEVEEEKHYWPYSRVPNSLLSIRTYAIQLTGGSRITVFCWQDTYSSLAQRLGVDKLWGLIRSLQCDQVKRELVDAAKNPPGAAVKAASYFGYERSVERLLKNPLAARLLGARCAAWVASATWSAGEEAVPSAGSCDAAQGAETVVDYADLSQLSAQEQTAVRELSQLVLDPRSLDWRFVVKNSFLEIVPADEDAAQSCERRARSCDAVLASRRSIEPPTSQAKALCRESSSAARWFDESADADAPALAPSDVLSQALGAAASPPARPVAGPKQAVQAKAGEATADEPASEAQRAEVSAGFGLAASEEERTTLMIRCLPLDLSRATLLRELDRAGLSGSYNFVYLPFDFSRRRGLGYALVSACSAEAAESIMTKMSDVRPEGSDPSEEAWQVGWSDPCRTLEGHIDRYRNSPVMHDSMPEEYKPLLFENGQRVPFPLPTRTIRTPRIRHLKVPDA